MRQIKISLLVLICIGLFIACRPPYSSPVPMRYIDIAIEDENGNNLLGTELYKDTIEITSDKTEVVTHEIIDGGTTVSIDISGHGYAMFRKDNPTVTTYIKWNAEDTDTIVASFVALECCYTYDKVYYNGNLVVKSYKEGLSWEDDFKSHITIIK